MIQEKGVDIGLRVTARDINCCNDVTCCIFKKKKATTIIETIDGEEAKIASDTILIFEKQPNRKAALRPIKRLEKIGNQDLLFQRTVSGYYSYLCKKYDPVTINVCAITRGVDFVKMYNRAEPLRIADISVMKTGLEELLPYKKTLLWIVDKIHGSAREISAPHFVASSNLLKKRTAKSSPLSKSMTVTRIPPLVQISGMQNITSEDTSQAIRVEENPMDAKLRSLFLEVAQARGIININEIPLISKKLLTLVQHGSSTPKPLDKLAKCGKTGFLRNLEGDHLICAAGLIHKLFEKHLPQFIQEEKYYPTHEDLNQILDSLANAQLTIGQSEDNLLIHATSDLDKLTLQPVENKPAESQGNSNDNDDQLTIQQVNFNDINDK